jgi:VWFA-related protein
MRVMTVLSGVLAWFVVVATPRAFQDNIDLVQLDVVVVDGKGQPIRGLTADDFTVKQDGRRVELTTFDEVTPGGDPEPRAFVLLLDDAGVPVQGTIVIQQIGKAFLESLRPADEVSVVRLGVRGDEPYGDRQTAQERILAYRAGQLPFVGWASIEDSLRHLTAVFRGLAIHDQLRKTVVCIGSPGVCNLDEPARYAPRSVDPLWSEAMRTAAQANIVVYAVIPGRARLRGGGLAELTGGEVFATTSNVGPAIDRIIRDADNFYMLGYWPGTDVVKGKSKTLHTLDVKVSRRGAKVHVRKRRGN